LFYGGNISVNNSWSVFVIESQFELIAFSMAEIMARPGKSDFHNSIKYLKKIIMQMGRIMMNSVFSVIINIVGIVSFRGVYVVGSFS
jgi:hypothetical protein